jgi:hypothetical protein
VLSLAPPLPPFAKNYEENAILLATLQQIVAGGFAK